MIEPQIKSLPEKKLVGMHIKTSLSENRTPELWRSFMPRRKEILNTMGTDLYSLRVYADSFDISAMNYQTQFDKWAAVEVLSFDDVPAGMEPLLLTGGQFAVFNYRGSAADAEPFFRHIYFEWLPKSGYVLVSRPHFEILGEKYKNNHPDSEEEIWIPVK